MMNRNDRMNTLNAAGIDTTKYFNLAIDKTLPKGTTLTITIGEDGLPTLTVDELKEIINKVEDQGYVKNSKLFRRWVMAQTFRMMKHKDGYQGALNEKPYAYQWTMLENELHAMSKIEKEDPEQFEVRKNFFTKEVILEMLYDYVEKLRKECQCGRYFYEDKYLQGFGIANITINAVREADTYARFYHIIKTFNKEVKTGYPKIGLPSNTKKCKAWEDAFKGAGSYYTMSNLIRFHFKTPIVLPCDNYDRTGEVVTATKKEAEMLLNMKRVEYKGEWYKLFGYFKRVIELNHFNFDNAMRKIYEEKRRNTFGPF